MAKRNRYKEMEQLMTALLIANAVVFVLYLIVAGAAIVWLQVLTAIICIATSVLSLVYLFLTRELLKPRSLWLSSGFFSIFICIVASLILQFP